MNRSVEWTAGGGRILVQSSKVIRGGQARELER